MSEIQLVVFKLDREEYGVNIMQVQEIGEYQQPVKVPNAPEFVEGIINLRGDVIPVVNLKKRFRLQENEITENTRLIVTNVGTRSIGFVVDDASEVLTLDEVNIQETPEIIGGQERRYISGIGKQDERLLIILDLNALFTDQEKLEIESI